MKTFELLEKSISEDCDTGIKKKEPIKDNHDVDVEEKKSVTEEAIVVEKLGTTATEPDPLPCNEK